MAGIHASARLTRRRTVRVHSICTWQREGFDARGFEMVPGGEVLQDEGDQDTDIAAPDRLWLIQCKRERTISPRKMQRHLAAFPRQSRLDLYGLVFAAACEFSKTPRDVRRGSLVKIVQDPGPSPPR